MSSSEHGTTGEYLSPTPVEMVQIYHDVLASIKDLPHQSEIDFSKFANRNPWRDLIADSVGSQGGSDKDLVAMAFRKEEERFPTLQSLLENTEDWASVFDGKGRYIWLYNKLCLMYRFQLEIPVSAFNPMEAEIQNNREAPDKGLDVSQLDGALNETLLKPIPFEQMPRLAEGTREKLASIGITRVGDIMLRGENTYKRLGISPSTIISIRNGIRRAYGIDRSALVANVATRNAIAVKYFALKGIERFSDQDETK